MRLPTRTTLWSRLVLDEGPAGCWLWPGAQNEKGYGMVSVIANGQKRVWRVGRVTYWVLVSPIAAGYEPDHLCRVRICGNPRHIEVVTAAENKRRALLIRNAGGPGEREACPHGHAWTEENIYRRPSDGATRCRECHRLTAHGGSVNSGEIVVDGGIIGQDRRRGPFSPHPVPVLRAGAGERVSDRDVEWWRSQLQFPRS